MADLNLNMVLNLRDKSTRKLRRFTDQLKKLNRELKRNASLAKISALASTGASKGGSRVSGSAVGSAAKGLGTAALAGGVLAGGGAIGASNKISNAFKSIRNSAKENLPPSSANMEQFGFSVDTMANKTAKADKKVSGLKWAGLAAIGVAVIGLIQQLGSIGGKFESLRTQLKSTTGSAEEAAIAFNFIKDVASGLPLSVDEATQAFVKMKNLGIEPTRERLESFSNTAAAQGKSLMDFVEAVADASVGEFERLKEFGIKASKQGDKVALRFKGQTKTIGNSAEEINDYLVSLGSEGGAFFGAATDQMDTLQGKMSNFGDAWEGLIDALFNDTFKDLFKSVVVGLTDIVTTTKDSFGSIRLFGISMIDSLVAGWMVLKHSVSIIMTVLSQGISDIFESIASTAIDSINLIISGYNKIKELFGGEPVELIEYTKGTKNLSVVLDELAAAQKKEREEHQAAMDLWADDIIQTSNATSSTEDYNKVLNDRADAQANASKTAKDLADNTAFLDKILKQVTAEIKTADDAFNALGKLDEMFQKGAIGSETYLMALDKVNSALGVTETESEQAFDKIAGFADEAASSMESSLSDVFFDPFTEGLDGMVQGFTSAINRMVANMLASGVMDLFAGPGYSKNGSADAGSILGGIFGGFRANGGMVTAGTSYLVGERGPELFTPPSSGDIIPNEAMGTSIYNTYNISAMDGTDALRVIKKNARGISNILQSNNANTQRFR